MGVLTAVLRTALDALLNATVRAVNDWRRDRDLKRLGYNTARLEQMEADRKLEEELRDVARSNVDRDTLTRRLRDRSF